ncbi:MAG: carbohydrate ABC transporter permease [Anaerolineae bacterium]|nr:carbohydrate ABC transporter permease [Anaerolineae bacterium]
MNQLAELDVEVVMPPKRRNLLSRLIPQFFREATRAEKVYFVIGFTILVIWAIFSLFPLYWMVVTAFKPSVAIMVTPPELIPRELTLRNFAIMLDSGIWRWTLNSFIVSGAVTFFQLFFSSMAGYAFAKKDFPGRNILFWLYIGSMMIPLYAIVVPLYRMMAGLKLLDTYFALILPGLAAPFGTFLMRQYIQSLPSELIDAAKIDGCDEWGVYRRIILPLSKPGLAVLGIFVFTGQWAEFFWPLIVTNTADMRVLTVGLTSFQLFELGSGMRDYGVLMAGATWAAIPMFVVFFLLQRYFLKGITLGALKG